MIGTRRKAWFVAGLIVGSAPLLLFLGWVRQWAFVEAPGGSTPGLPAVVRPLPFGPGERLAYRVDWNGVPAGELSMGISGRTDGALWTLDYQLKSVGAIDALYRLRLEGRTIVDAETLLPRSGYFSEQKRDRLEEQTTVFDQAAGTAAVVVRKSTREEEDTETVEIRPGLDVLCALLIVRAIDAPEDRPVRLLVLKEDDVYEALITALGRSDMQVPAGEFEATELGLALRKLDDEADEGDEEGMLRYRRMRLWVSREGRLPVLLEADLISGLLRAELVAFVEEVGADLRPSSRP